MGRMGRGRRRRKGEGRGGWRDRYPGKGLAGYGLPVRTDIIEVDDGWNDADRYFSCIYGGGFPCPANIAFPPVIGNVC